MNQTVSRLGILTFLGFVACTSSSPSNHAGEAGTGGEGGSLVNAGGETGTGGAGGGTGELPLGLEVVTVDPEGNPVEANLAVWFDTASPPFVLRTDAEPLPCAGGAAACSSRSLSSFSEERIHVVVGLTQPDRAPPVSPDGFVCSWWDSQFTVVHKADAGQRVHIVLNPDRTWCDDGLSPVATPAYIPPTVHPLDIRFVPSVTERLLVLSLTDQEGLPLPSTAANWYFSPEGPDHDGEHLLACADALCTKWTFAAGDGPAPGKPRDIYVNATYTGPFHALPDAHLGDYAGSPITLAEGSDVLELTLSMNTDIAGIE